MKQVKISEELFNRLYDFFENLELHSILCDLYTPLYLQEYEELGSELRKKHDAMQRRETFSAYKAAADPDQREQLRREYLDRAGIDPNCRSSEEIPDEYL